MTPFFIYDGLYIDGPTFHDHDYYALSSSLLDLISCDEPDNCNRVELLYKNRERPLLK